MTEQVINEGSIQEDQLTFAFSSEEHLTHQVLKFDETRTYRNVENRVDQTKGIDILGLMNTEQILMIEVKDFSGEGRASSKLSGRGTELIEEVAQKVRDSCAIIVHGSRLATHDEQFWREVGNILLNGDKKIQVLLWVELNLKGDRLRQRLSIYRDKLSEKLKWLKAQIHVSSIETNSPVHGMEVSKENR